jgi:hypothetical protein
MSSKAIVAWIGIGIGVLTGCGGSGEEEADAAEGQMKEGEGREVVKTPPAPTAAAENLQATITTKTLKKEGKPCSLDISYPSIDAKSPAATAAIAQVLPAPEEAKLCADLEPTDESTVEGSFMVAANDHGVLSLTTSDSFFFSGAAHPSFAVRGYTFDIKTGKRLKLADVLTADGLKLARKACVAALTSAEAGQFFDESSAGEECDGALRDSADSPASFTLGKDGFRLTLDLPHAIAAIGLEGAAIPLKDLGPAVTSGLVANWVKAQAQ